MRTNTKLQQKIMRRVYYTFGVRLATHSVTLHAVILLIAGYLLASLVHVEMVLRNLATTEVADLGGKVTAILFNADAISLVVLGIAIFAALSLPLRLPHWQLTRLRNA